MNRIKKTEVKLVRQRILVDQGHVCGICGIDLPIAQSNLDHDHKSGMVRGVLCRPCNTLLGKIENYFNTFGHHRQVEFLEGAWQYIHDYSTCPTDVYHYSYKTDEEKRLARNAKARKARALKRSIK